MSATFHGSTASPGLNRDWLDRLLSGVWLPASICIMLAFVLLWMISDRVTIRPKGFHEPEVVTFLPHAFSYRLPGEFVDKGVPTDAPKITAHRTQPLTITKFQISVDEYGLCASARMCRPLPEDQRHGFPAVNLSYDDAVAYAMWISKVTATVWRLPTDEEMAFAVGKAFPDDALGLAKGNKNPALRWIAEYDREVKLSSKPDPAPRPTGSFGTSENGLSDFGGNVWEWTTTCQRKVDLANPDRSDSGKDCGVYITVGKHRSPINFFVTDPKGGACSVGRPPDNLGFRLVKET